MSIQYVVVDGVNDDGVSGWELLLTHDGVLLRRDWHSDYGDPLEPNPVTAGDMLELLWGGTDRVWPESLPEDPSHRNHRLYGAMVEWSVYLLCVFRGDACEPPAWLPSQPN